MLYFTYQYSFARHLTVREKHLIFDHIKEDISKKVDASIYSELNSLSFKLPLGFIGRNNLYAAVDKVEYSFSEAGSEELLKYKITFFRNFIIPVTLSLLIGVALQKPEVFGFFFLVILLSFIIMLVQHKMKFEEIIGHINNTIIKTSLK